MPNALKRDLRAVPWMWGSTESYSKTQRLKRVRLFARRPGAFYIL
jgi:hypothetical protein